MRTESGKPFIMSAIPAVAMPATPRSVSAKRLSRLRINWFAIGAVFGVGLSLFLNFVVAVLVLPTYHRALAYWNAPGTAAPTPVALAAAPTPIPALSTPPAPAPLPTYPVTLSLKLGKGDTILGMLVENRVEPGEAHNVVNTLKKKINPGNLRAGQRISITLDRHEKLGDSAAVKELAIKLPNLSTVELQRLQDGGFAVDAKEFTSSEKTYRGFGKVRSSLLQAAAEGGIPSSVMGEVLKAYSYDIDFQREIHPGDTIEVLIDRKPSKSGGFTTNGGTVRYAALTLRGKKHEIFRYKNSFGEMAWFDGKGNSVKKSLLRTPLDAARITSGFGMRTHPIMGYSKMHRGVDFGAPTGTPVMAAGDGVVAFRGWKGGYGNFLLIKHNTKYETAYGHLSRFAKLKVGDRVKQGQVVAYVGSTGMSTGPHLHYEVREAGNQVNPVSKQFNMAAGLSGKSLAAFKTAKQSAVNELASLAKPKTAQVASTQ